MNVRILAVLVGVVASVWLADTAGAQCAMCVTALEQNGGELAAGFNRGILFMLATPYLVFTAIGASWYRKRRQRLALEPVSVSE